MKDLPYIFVDTGAWYALLDKSDANHRAAVKFYDSLVHPLVTSNYIADEVMYKLCFNGTNGDNRGICI